MGYLRVVVCPGDWRLHPVPSYQLRYDGTVESISTLAMVEEVANKRLSVKMRRGFEVLQGVSGRIGWL